VETKKKGGMKGMIMQSLPRQDLSIVARKQDFGRTAKRTKESEFDLVFGKSIKKEAYDSINENTKNINRSEEKASMKSKKDNIDISKDKQAFKTYDSNRPDDKSIDTSKTLGKLVEDKDAPEDEMVLSEQVIAVLSQIQNAIMDLLKLTPEEMEQMMSDLDMDLSDLSESQAILQLVMANNAITDPTEVLLDEDLADTFQAILSIVNEHQKDLPSELSKDQIKMILMEDSQDLAETDDMVEPILSQNNESNDVKNTNESQQFNSDKIDISNNTRPVVETTRSDQADTKDSKEGFNETEGFEAFIEKLTTNYDNPFVEITGDNLRQYEISEIAKQIIEEIRVAINPKQTSMELQLNPEHLGKVNLTLSSKEGLMSAHFVVENDLAKEAVESQMFILKETLDQQGIKVETIEVTVASYTFDQNNQSDEANQMLHKKQRIGKKITFEEAIAMNEQSPDLDDTIDHSGIHGYTVNYTA
jgi:flagellar hook-length control protein FliK